MKTMMRQKDQNITQELQKIMRQKDQNNIKELKKIMKDQIEEYLKGKIIEHITCLISLVWLKNKANTYKSRAKQK